MSDMETALAPQRQYFQRGPPPDHDIDYFYQLLICTEENVQDLFVKFRAHVTLHDYVGYLNDYCIEPEVDYPTGITYAGRVTREINLKYKGNWGHHLVNIQRNRNAFTIYGVAILMACGMNADKPDHLGETVWRAIDKVSGLTRKMADDIDLLVLKLKSL